MRRHPKASSAGPTTRQATGLGRSPRGAFEIRGASGDSKGSGAPWHRPTAFVRVLLTALLCATFLSMAFVAQASAVTRVLTGRFGPDGTSATAFNSPQSVAVNQTTKTLYLLDSGVSKIYAFDVSTPGVFSPLAGNFPLTVPASTGIGRGIAVDNTALPSAGNLYYVASGTDQKIYGYTAAGVPLGGSFPVTVPQTIAGAGVDSTGQVWVVDRVAPIELRRYSSTGLEGTPIDVATSFGGITGNFNQGKLALDSNDDLYFGGGAGPVYKVTSASGYTARTEAAPSTPAVNGVSVDPVTHNLYISRDLSGNRRIEARNSSGTLLYEFGKFILGDELTTQIYKGIAVNGSRDEIYAAEETRLKQLTVFSPPGSPPVPTLDPESGLTGTHATLNGKVNPEGGAISECKFEYGLTASYGQSAPCSGSIPTDSSPHPVSAALTSLKPQGTTYHYRLIIKNTFGTAFTTDATFVTPATFFTGSASPIATSTATLNGSVNPDGVALTDCKFEYGISSAYGSTAPCSPAAGAIPADSVPHPVSAPLTGLNGNTTYHFRISVSSALGTSLGADQTFETLGVPQILTEAISPVDRTSATLYAEVNPRGFNTNYRFEYGKTAAYGGQVPAEIELFAGAGTLPVKGSAKLSGLQEDTTYHYRVVATNSAGTAIGPDQTFTTRNDPGGCANAEIRAAQVSAVLPNGTAGLPACMGLEMVSPPAKENQPVKQGGTQANNSVSVDGGHVLFRSGAALGGTEGVVDVNAGDVYVASRGEDGWTTTATILRPMFAGSEPKGFSPDLSRWFQIAAETDQRNQEAIFQPFESRLNRQVAPFSSPLLTADQPQDLASYAGSSGDGSHLYVKMGNQGGASPARLLPGDPKPEPAATARANVYVLRLADDGQPASLQLLARDALGKAWGGNCGARVGGDVELSVSQGQPSQRVRVQGAISTDGSRVYFSTRASQPEGVDCNSANRMRILERTETPVGPVIADFIQNECNRVSPACDATAGDDYFQTASADGERVYFLTNRQLVNSDLDSGASCGLDLGQATGCDLYLYEKLSGGGHKLVQVSAGDASDPTPGAGAKVLNNIAGISTDGSHVYFAAEGVLTTAPNRLGLVAQAGKPNLYLYERDPAYPNGRTAFVGTLSSADSGELWGARKIEAFGPSSVYPVPAIDPDTGKVDGDGHVLLFKSKAQLTGNDTDGSRRDVYRYDSKTGSLQCVSCLPGGDSAGGEVREPEPAELDAGKPQGPAFASLGRWVSEDGDSVVFQTTAPLLPSDTNGLGDEYLWRDGQLTLLPGVDLEDAPTISGDGSTVAFRRAEPLLPQDGDSVADVYVLRAGGGFPIPSVKEACVGEGCQEPFRSQPTTTPAGSEAPSDGNVRERPPAHCRKGFVRRKGKCVKRHPRKKHHREKNRAAGNRQGGSK